MQYLPTILLAIVSLLSLSMVVSLHREIQALRANAILHANSLQLLAGLHATILAIHDMMVEDRKPEEEPTDGEFAIIKKKIKLTDKKDANSEG